MKQGLFGKYLIEKADGTPIDPKASYFVLRLDTDRWARHAARTYARTIREENPLLAADLETRCNAYSFAERAAESKK